MKKIEPVALSIAGFDPSAGAGILADIKTMEQLHVYGLAVISANTVQHENEVHHVEWQNIDTLLQQMQVLLRMYRIQFVKIGIIENSSVLLTIKDQLIKHNPEIKIIWDPVFRASSGYAFCKNEHTIAALLDQLYLVTPNLPEFKNLFTDHKQALLYSKQCNIFLKGGHSKLHPGVDYLFSSGREITYKSEAISNHNKHGSGCVLSSAITAALARGQSLEEACRIGKNYTKYYLGSHQSLLGWHNNNL